MWQCLRCNVRVQRGDLLPWFAAASGASPEEVGARTKEVQHAAQRGACGVMIRGGLQPQTWMLSVLVIGFDGVAPFIH